MFFLLWFDEFRFCVLFFLVFVNPLNVFDTWLPCVSSVLIHYCIYLQFSYLLLYLSAVQFGVCTLSHMQLCSPRDCSPPDSVHGIFQARLLEWIFPFFIFNVILWDSFSISFHLCYCFFEA